MTDNFHRYMMDRGSDESKAKMQWDKRPARDREALKQLTTKKMLELLLRMDEWLPFSTLSTEGAAPGVLVTIPVMLYEYQRELEKLPSDKDLADLKNAVEQQLKLREALA